MGELLSSMQAPNVTHAPSNIDTHLGVEGMDFGGMNLEGMKEVNDLRGGYENDVMSAMHDSFEGPEASAQIEDYRALVTQNVDGVLESGPVVTHETFAPSEDEPFDPRLGS